MEKFKRKFHRGFTLVELLVSMGILAVVFAISTIALSSIIPNTSQSNARDSLISDIRSQQTQAMTNDASYGILFENTSYTLFKGAVYSASDPNNYVVNLDPSLLINDVTFNGKQIIFSPGTGDVSGYIQGSDGMTITNSQTGINTNIKINKYGATY